MVSAVGAPGSGALPGVTGADGSDGSLVPALLVAVTVKVYAVLFVSPVICIGDTEPDAVPPPGLAVTVYDVIGAPPVEKGAVNATDALVFPAVAMTPVGADGAVGVATVAARLNGSGLAAVPFTMSAVAASPACASNGGKPSNRCMAASRVKWFAKPVKLLLGT